MLCLAAFRQSVRQEAGEGRALWFSAGVLSLDHSRQEAERICLVHRPSTAVLENAVVSLLLEEEEGLGAMVIA